MYDRIKSRHLVFGESREEKEVRVDSEHALLLKGKLSGHQFEPLLEASIAELESVGLGKTQRELYLSYLRKMPANLQKEMAAAVALAFASFLASALSLSSSFRASAAAELGGVALPLGSF